MDQSATTGSDRFDGQSPALIIIEQDSFLAQFLPQDFVFGFEIRQSSGTEATQGNRIIVRARYDSAMASKVGCNEMGLFCETKEIGKAADRT